MKDILILKNINHPILPQLDYSFLNITVANPAINRSVLKNTINDVKPPNNVSTVHNIPTVQFSGPIATAKNYDNLPTFSKPILPKEPPNINLIPELKNLSINGTVSQPLKFDVAKGSTNVNFTSPPKSNNLKNYEFLNLTDISGSLEPRSLDLPTFEAESAKNVDDDEFTEFQSATIVTNNDEYTDFQSASPLVKFEMDNLIAQPSTQQTISSQNGNIDLTTDLGSLSGDEQLEQKCIDADKYDVFRSLMAHPKKKADDHEDEDEDDDEDDDEEEEEDEEENNDDKFGDFFSVEVQPEKNKSLSIKVGR